MSFQDRDHLYRDRAAERRALHGGFGVGPGQKISPNSDNFVPLDESTGPEEALSESLSNSFGAGSYARRMLENMGWKEVHFRTFTTSRIIVLATSVTEEVLHYLEMPIFGSQESRDPHRLVKS